MGGGCAIAQKWPRSAHPRPGPAGLTIKEEASPCPWPGWGAWRLAHRVPTPQVGPPELPQGQGSLAQWAQRPLRVTLHGNHRNQGPSARAGGSPLTPHCPIAHHVGPGRPGVQPASGCWKRGRVMFVFVYEKVSVCYKHLEIQKSLPRKTIIQEIITGYILLEVLLV